MKIKALISFSGALTMAKGEVREYGNKEVISDLVRAGYVEEVKETPKRSVKNEGKRDNE